MIPNLIVFYHSSTFRNLYSGLMLVDINTTILSFHVVPREMSCYNSRFSEENWAGSELCETRQ